jgi:hypothetical protein
MGRTSFLGQNLGPHLRCPRGDTNYGPTGMSAGTCDLPNVVSFQTVTSDALYALNLNEIVSVSTGAVSWASGDAVTSGYTPPNSIVLSFFDTLAGNHVVFVSGAQVVVQSY